MPFPEHTITALLGQAVGDSFGCPFEYHAGAPVLSRRSVEEQRYLDGLDDCRLPVRRCRTAGLYSDDTQQALVLLWIWSQLEAKGHDPHLHADVAELFLRVCGRMADTVVPGNMSFGVHRGTGRNFRQAVMHRVAPHTAGLGAAMRIGPVATLIRDRDLVAPWVVGVSRATTSHPVALAGAAMVAVEAWDLAHGETSPSRAIPASVGGDVQNAWDILLDAREVLRGEDGPANLVALAESTGLSDEPIHGLADGFALTGVPWVLHHAEQASDFESALLGVCASGGDTDTVAAMTGCLAALRLGRDAVPVWMTEGLVGLDHILDPDLWSPVRTEKTLTDLDRELQNRLERRIRERVVARQAPVAFPEPDEE